MWDRKPPYRTTVGAATFPVGLRPEHFTYMSDASESVRSIRGEDWPLHYCPSSHVVRPAFFFRAIFAGLLTHKLLLLTRVSLPAMLQRQL